MCVFISGDVISGLPRSHVHSGPDPFYADKISICHVTHMRLSDWSLFEMRPSDWLCPKPPPYTTGCLTMPKGIMGNGGSWSMIEALCVSAT